MGHMGGARKYFQNEVGLVGLKSSGFQKLLTSCHPARLTPTGLESLEEESRYLLDPSRSLGVTFSKNLC